MTVKQERRPALATYKYNNPKYAIVKDEPKKCFVLGLFQCSEEDGPNPYFIVEFESGQCFYAAPEQVVFVDGGEFDDTDFHRRSV